MDAPCATALVFWGSVPKSVPDSANLTPPTPTQPNQNLAQPSQKRPQTSNSNPQVAGSNPAGGVSQWRIGRGGLMGGRADAARRLSAAFTGPSREDATEGSDLAPNNVPSD
jgi:hypothetical protein